VVALVRKTVEISLLKSLVKIMYIKLCFEDQLQPTACMFHQLQQFRLPTKPEETGKNVQICNVSQIMSEQTPKPLTT
jgi:hypothetical protein